MLDVNAIVERALPLTKQHEGWRAHPYDDATGERIYAPKGNITIGFGFNLEAGGLPINIATEWLRDRLAVAVEDAASVIPNYSQHGQTRQALFADMAYNLGRNGMSTFQNMIAAACVCDYEAVADEMLDSRAAKQAPWRDKRLAEYMRKGEIDGRMAD